MSESEYKLGIAQSLIGGGKVSRRNYPFTKPHGGQSGR
jgi:hypothetical protein